MGNKAPDKITHLIAAGESMVLEFKNSFDRQVIETLSAFANTKGGTVLVGVNDHGQIVGVQFDTETRPAVGKSGQIGHRTVHYIEC